MGNMTPRIRLRDGAFSYGAHPIFQNLSLDLAAGQVFCLLGPNGCGKTTLLRCLNGLAPLKAGTLWLDGQEISHLSETNRAKKIGFVPQEHNVLFPYSVLETVRMGRAPHLGLFASPSRHDTAIAKEALDIIGIPHLQHKPYTQISGGERQMALIARALTQQPSILLLDEPTSHLDFGNQVLVLQTVHRLARERGLAVIMATHFPGHALLVSHHVALMKDGGFVATGPAETVITESYLQQLYGIDVKVLSVSDGSTGNFKAVVPLLSGITV
jgi:iron complex transport system ATP-binding protein